MWLDRWAKVRRILHYWEMILRAIRLVFLFVLSAFYFSPFLAIFDNTSAYPYVLYSFIPWLIAIIILEGKGIADCYGRLGVPMLEPVGGGSRRTVVNLRRPGTEKERFIVVNVVVALILIAIGISVVQFGSGSFVFWDWNADSWQVITTLAAGWAIAAFACLTWQYQSGQAERDQLRVELESSRTEAQAIESELINRSPSLLISRIQIRASGTIIGRSSNV